MPLNTQITRDGKVKKLAWSQQRIAAITVAAALDSDWKCLFTEDVRPEGYPETPILIGAREAFALVHYGIIAQTPLNDGNYTLKSKHHFVLRYLGGDEDDDFVLLPGDELMAMRSFS